MINDLTPGITGKAFHPDWFLLKQRLDEVDRIINQRDKLAEAIREFAKTFVANLPDQSLYICETKQKK